LCRAATLRRAAAEASGRLPAAFVEALPGAEREDRDFLLAGVLDMRVERSRFLRG
jgi:hypothetical protein